MSFHEVRFPTDIALGSDGGPSYSTSIIESDGGAEQRIGRLANGRHRYSVSYSGREANKIATVQAFYRARRGAEYGFRFKDFYDFHSSPTNPTYIGAPGSRDQLIGVGDGTATQFQLSKRYVSGPTTRVRNITKPVAGTVRVWVNGSELLTGWTVDTTTGIVTFTSAPGSGQNVEASFEFDVPVRFSKEVDEAGLLASHDGFDDGAIEAPMIEIPDLDPAQGDFPYGGDVEVAISGDYVLPTGEARLFVVSASTTGLSVKCPNPTNIPTGGVVATVSNQGANSFALKDHAGATLATLSAGQTIDLLLSTALSGQKVWTAA